jgi:ATP-dependent Clp protease ATP-binding subunit ClpA
VFERFTIDARQVVVRAQEEARLLHHGFIGCEHLLLALSGGQDSPAAAALTAFGVETGELRQRVADFNGAGAGADAGPLDADALAELGIDLDSVRRAAEASFGPGALDRPACGGLRAGHIPFTPRAKKSLQLALRTAVRRKDREITPGHLLLGVIAQRDNAALRLLKAEGVGSDELREEVSRRMTTPGTNGPGLA